MKPLGLLVTLGVVVGLTGCKATGASLSIASFSRAGGAPLVANNGGGLIANNSAGLTGVVRGPASLITDHGGGLIANNGGGLITDHGGGLIANNGGGFRTLAMPEEVPLAGLTVRLTTPGGQAVLVDGKPVTAQTDREGRFTLQGPKTAGRLQVVVELPGNRGSLRAIAFMNAARPLAVDLASTLTARLLLKAEPTLATLEGAEWEALEAVVADALETVDWGALPDATDLTLDRLATQLVGRHRPLREALTPSPPPTSSGSSSGSDDANSGIQADRDRYEGDLLIETAAQLEQLKAYRVVGGKVEIRGLPGVTTIALPQLQSVGGYFLVTDCPDLETLEVPALAQVGVADYLPPSSPDVARLSIGVFTNAALERVQLGPVQAVEGAVGFGENDVLQTLEGVDHLETVGGYFAWIGQPLITNFDAFPGLKSCKGFVVNQSGITALPALTETTDLPLGLILIENANLTSLAGLEGLSTAHHVGIERNPLLTSVAGLSGLTTVADYVTLAENALLTQVDGLEALTTVGADFSLHLNPILADISGLSGLRTAANLHVGSNPLLGQACTDALRAQLVDFTGAYSAGPDLGPTCP